MQVLKGAIIALCTPCSVAMKIEAVLQDSESQHVSHWENLSSVVCCTADMYGMTLAETGVQCSQSCWGTSATRPQVVMGLLLYMWLSNWMGGGHSVAFYWIVWERERGRKRGRLTSVAHLSPVTTHTHTHTYTHAYTHTRTHKYTHMHTHTYTHTHTCTHTIYAHFD